MKHIKKAIVFLIGIIITVFILASCDIRSINFVDAPAADNTTYTYTGSEITYKIKEESYYTITNNKQTNAGTYDVIVSLNNKEKDMWSSTRSSDDLVYKFAGLNH